MIFAGDLGQLRPVGSSALYAAELLVRLAGCTTETLHSQRDSLARPSGDNLPTLSNLRRISELSPIRSTLLF